jgi:hypothetical protein
MLGKATEKFFSLWITIVYRKIGTKFRTDAFKLFWDIFFIVFEKTGYKFDIISKNYLRLYDDLVEKEIRMAQISSKDHILVIGCGSLPATSVLIALKTQATIICIDIDLKAVNDAILFLKNLNLHNQITVKQADGTQFPVDDFDYIFVLYGIRNPKKILNYLVENTSNKTGIIFRTICDKNGELSNTSLGVTKLFNIKGHVTSEYLGSVDSLLLSKK